MLNWRVTMERALPDGDYRVIFKTANYGYLIDVTLPAERKNEIIDQVVNNTFSAQELINFLNRQNGF